MQPDGSVATAKAVAINAAFERSLEFWSSLREQGRLDPTAFLHQAPHISAVWTPENIAFLRQRYSQLKELPAFAAMEWSEDRKQLMEWMPLVMAGRDLKQPVAATRISRGTDVDFGALTRAYLLPLQRSGALTIQYGTDVRDLKRLRRPDMTEGDWQVILDGPSGRRELRTPFVFLGAGGGALPLLQRSGIPEAGDFAGFPVSGLWLVCNNPELADAIWPRSMARPRLGRRQCRCPISTPAGWMASARCCSDPMPDSAASSSSRGRCSICRLQCGPPTCCRCCRWASPTWIWCAI